MEKIEISILQKSYQVYLKPKQKMEISMEGLL